MLHHCSRPFRPVTAVHGLAALALASMTSCAPQPSTPASTAAPAVAPADVRTIAREAYIYGFPLVDSYRIQHAYFVNSASPEFKGAWNTVHNVPRVYTPADTAVQTPNSDTPYSMIGFDLRAEPQVITFPAIEQGRYVSLQLIDAYTHNFDYAGSRTTGNGGGSFLIAGPSWKGETPAGIARVFRAETDIALGIIRTQLFGAADLDNVKKIQAGYTLQPLSAFLKQPPPPAAPAISFITPLTAEEQKTSPEFFNLLNFVLQFTPTHPSEQALMERFAIIGVGAGKRIDVASLPEETRQALVAGMADGQSALAAFEKSEIATGKVTSGDLFGTRDKLKNDYLRRYAGAVLGIYGNSTQEAMYPLLKTDATGAPLDGATSAYTLRFAKDQLPPVNAFWSMTMYKLPESLLVANPIDRYLINSPMLPSLKRDADGGLTLYVQKGSPGKDKEANWLPAPDGQFLVVLRLYWPKDEAIDGRWKVPALTRVP